MCRIQEDSEAVIVLLQQSDDMVVKSRKNTFICERKGNREREREKERALAISSFSKDAPESFVPFLNVQLG